MTGPRKFDPANYLDDDAAVATYVTEALETGDLRFITDALGVAARARLEGCSVSHLPLASPSR